MFMNSSKNKFTLLWQNQALARERTFINLLNILVIKIHNFMLQFFFSFHQLSKHVKIRHWMYQQRFLLLLLLLFSCCSLPLLKLFQSILIIIFYQFLEIPFLWKNSCLSSHKNVHKSISRLDTGGLVSNDKVSQSHVVTKTAT